MRHLYIHSPAVVAAGQINDSFDEEYPVGDLPVMNVTVGDMDDVKPNMTVIFGSAPGKDDLGRQRVRRNIGDSDLAIGYSSRGLLDGEVSVEPGDYFTVLDDRRLWVKMQRVMTQEVAPFYFILKDYDQHFESNGAGLLWYPKANAGPPRAGNVDADTGGLTVTLPGPLGVESYGIPGAVDVVGYLWDVGAGTITVGTVTDASITAIFPPGLHFVALTVTDENGLTHRMETVVLARDPDDDNCVEAWELQGWTTDSLGHRISVRLDSEVPRADYPDGTLVILFDDTDEDHHTDFFGWHHTGSVSLAFGKTGAPDTTVFECLGPLHKADQLRVEAQIIAQQETVYTFTVADDAAEGAVLVTTEPLPVALPDGAELVINSITVVVVGNVPAGYTAFGVEPLDAALTEGDIFVYTQNPRNWAEMRDPSMYKWLDYLARWHSNLLDLVDWAWPPVNAAYTFLEREAGQSTLFRQLNEQARSIVPEHSLRMNRVGQVVMRVDQMLQADTLRTATVLANLVGHISAIRVVHQRPPRVGQIRGAGVVQGLTPTATTVEVEYTIRPSAQALSGATAIPVYALPVTIPTTTTLYLRGLDDILLPWATTSSEASEGATSIPVSPLADTVDVWDELVYVATEAGPDRIVTLFCLAPGRVPGQGEQTITVNNKVIMNQAALSVAMGNLYARLNAEYGIIDVDLVDDGDLGLDPALEGWVTLGPFASRFVPARDLALFTESARYVLLEVNRTLRASKTGTVMQTTLRLERETVGKIAATVGGEEIA